mgnify:CR=1 FL=1
MMQKAGTKKENRLVKSIKGTKSEFKKIVPESTRPFYGH